MKKKKYDIIIDYVEDVVLEIKNYFFDENKYCINITKKKYF